MVENRRNCRLKQETQTLGKTHVYAHCILDFLSLTDIDQHSPTVGRKLVL
jgi:hypothetical protein